MSVDGAPEEDADTPPRAVRLDGRWLAVAELVDRWRVEDEWWRAPIRRCYLLLLMANGRLLTLFQDLETGGWYRQPYWAPHGPR